MSILHKIFTQRATRVSATHHRSRCLRESTTSALTVLYTSLDGATEAAQTINWSMTNAILPVLVIGLSD